MTAVLAGETLCRRPGIRGAVQRGELVLHYQPIVELRSRRPVAAEALLRWRRADVLAAPGAFWHDTDIACAQEIGQFVLDAACRQLAAWRADGLCTEVSVNTDPRELSAGWVASVYDALARNDLPPAALNVELTETSRIDPLLGPQVAAALIRRGVGVALDDAGTGFNALAAVSELPLTELKIDRSFVSRLGDPRADALVRGLVAISRELGMRTVAEGVETEQQAQLLEHYGVHRAQGYLFSRPVAPAELADYWRRAHGQDAVALKLIREMAGTGASPATIAAVLNRRGVTGPNGRSWRPATVSRVLLAQPVAIPSPRRA
ncbi:MAG TPA: EAL domain-containing protein [Mycobacteriales bacterium]|nr:EAL domain-containing protein [Mycobacteriales bacterium]